MNNDSRPSPSGLAPETPTDELIDNLRFQRDTILDAVEQQSLSELEREHLIKKLRQNYPSQGCNVCDCLLAKLERRGSVFPHVDKPPRPTSPVAPPEQDDDLKRLRSEFASAGYDMKKMSAPRSVAPEQDLDAMLDTMMEAFSFEAGIEFFPLDMPQYSLARAALRSYVTQLREERNLVIKTVLNQILAASLRSPTKGK